MAVRRLVQKIMSTRKNGCARETRERRSLPRVPSLAGFFLHPFLAPVTREARASIALGRKTIVRIEDRNALNKNLYYYYYYYYFTGTGANEAKVDDTTLSAFGI